VLHRTAQSLFCCCYWVRSTVTSYLVQISTPRRYLYPIADSCAVLVARDCRLIVYDLPGEAAHPWLVCVRGLAAEGGVLCGLWCPSWFGVLHVIPWPLCCWCATVAACRLDFRRTGRVKSSCHRLPVFSRPAGKCSCVLGRNSPVISRLDGVLWSAILWVWLCKSSWQGLCQAVVDCAVR
jgi:hypothetical protein